MASDRSQTRPIYSPGFPVFLKKGEWLVVLRLAMDGVNLYEAEESCKAVGARKFLRKAAEQVL